MIFKEGDKFEVKFTVSPEIYEGFITLFDDRNPLHTDAAFAESKGFRDKVMHGNILNGFLSSFVGEHLPVKNVIIHLQEIKFNNAVYLGDALILHATVTDVFESVQAVEFKYQFRNSTQELVAKGKIQIGLI